MEDRNESDDIVSTNNTSLNLPPQKSLLNIPFDHFVKFAVNK